MRPRLIAVDDDALPRGGGRRELASMRPRLIAVDDVAAMQRGSVRANGLQ